MTAENPLKEKQQLSMEAVVCVRLWLAFALPLLFLFLSPRARIRNAGFQKESSPVCSVYGTRTMVRGHLHRFEI